MTQPMLTTRTALAFLLCAAAMLLQGCRAVGLWSGSEINADGSLRVAAEEPACGCLTLTNRTNGEVYLRSLHRGSSLGGAALAAGSTRVFKFDWAGQENDEVYDIEATDKGGQRIQLREGVVDHETRPMDCERTQCVYGTLLMNVAQQEEP